MKVTKTNEHGWKIEDGDITVIVNLWNKEAVIHPTNLVSLSPAQLKTALRCLQKAARIIKKEKARII